MGRIHPNLIKQIELEGEAWDNSLSKYDNKLIKAIERGSIQDSKEVIIIVKATIDKLSDYIKEYLELSLRGKNKKCQMYLRETFENADNIAYALIKSLLGILLNNNNNPKILLVAKALVTNLKQYNNIQALKKEKPKLYSYIEQHNKRKGDSVVKKQKRKVARKLVSKELDKEITILLGTTCIDLVNKSGCNLINILKDKNASYIVQLSKETKALFLRSRVFFGSLVTYYYPFIYPPKDWTSLQGSGGYYIQQPNIPFIKHRTKKDKYIIEAEKPDLDRLMSVVNNIQQTSYRINKKVLETIQTIIKYNLVDHRSTNSNPILYGGIPYMETLNIHELVPKGDYGKIQKDGKFEKLEDKIAWLKAMDAQDTKIRRIESKRLSYKLALITADKFKDYEKLYFSYNLDFRSRLYPIQQYLNPQLSSNIKALLEFREGQKLNSEGVYWLKVHGANCYGYDKLIYEERIQEIDKKEEEIKRIAQDPISNIKLWYKADSPLLYLAFCFSYALWLSNNDALIHTPVQIDATCSGIQIYSGLLKDYKGALAVNVIMDDNKVNDIYKEVAELVTHYLKNNDYPTTITYKTKDGVEHTKNTLIEAQSIKNNIDRSLTKRNVMTQPYSVTKRGMYEQVYDLLSDYEDNNKVFWKGEKWIVATLLAKLNDRAIGEIVKGARRGQIFLKQVLKEALKTTDEAFWYSPIYNFPIIQRIKRERKQRLRTPLGSLVLYHPTDKTHYLKMLNGIAPNYIHSLDATLLYRTVERCVDRGIKSFWLIHDSYGVLPNDIPILNEEVREAYIEIFEDNPLADWVAQILPDRMDVLDKVMVDDLDISKVRNSRYFFS